MCEVKNNKYINIQTEEELDLEKLQSLPDNAMLKVKPELFCEWDFEKNNELGLDIFKMSKGSDKKVWWICHKCKSEFQSSIYNRVGFNCKCPYCSGRKVNHTNSLFTMYPDIAKEWHATKNGDLTPHDVTVKSGKKIWWTCSKCNNDIHVVVYSRTVNECAYCSGKLATNETSLASTRPEIAREWCYDKNGDLTPESVLPNSHKKAWWKCPDCESSYQSSISNRTKGNKCPYCRGLKVNDTNSLSYISPITASEWHPTKNINLTPHDVTCGSHKKVWWLGKCGHEWDSAIYNRIKGHGCPYCVGKRVDSSNSLASLKPEISEMWHPNRNNKSPHEVTCGSSHDIYWWICKLGHEYEARIDSVVRGDKCPYCSNKKLLVRLNDMWTTNPELASLLADPEDGYKYMQSVAKKVNWKCPKCKTVIKDKSINNVSRQGICCQVCNDSMSFSEKILYQVLRDLDVSFDYDKGMPFSKGKRYDFILNNNIIVELHGIQHYESSPRGRSLDEEQDNDKLKYEMAMQNGIKEYIIIDCRNSDFEFIKNNILNSRLSELLNLDDYSFNCVDMSTSLIDMCWDLKVNKQMGVVAISRELKIGRNRVSKYIKLKEESINRVG